ncbi:MAG: sensor domain-containing diguanylate cyclase [Clostridiaceae bacterium]|nr:sensor domain-containing diguanylate cyclase [Clostridiaceae bacterium]
MSAYKSITNRVAIWKYNSQKSNDVLRSILEISDSILTITNTQELFQVILQKSVESIDAAKMGSLLILNENNELEYKALVGYDSEKFKDVTLKLEDCFLYKSNHGDMSQACIVKDVEKFDKLNLNKNMYEKLQLANAFITKSAISAPIKVNNKLYGMINVDSTEIDGFTHLDKSFMEYFANQISTVIKTHELLDKTIYLSRHDNLTGIYNRYYFEELLNDLLDRAKRYEESFSIVMFDLDNLKIINDTFGHQLGDELIQHFAQGMKGIIRQTDIIARYGGDEFVGIFLYASVQEVNYIINKLRDYFSLNPLHVKDHDIHNLFSYGMAHYPTDAKRSKDLLKIADDRMYLHKQKYKYSK